MTTTTDHEDRAGWVPDLIAWAEQERDHYEATAFRLRWRGHLDGAADYMALAAKRQEMADRARVLLVDLEGPALPPPVGLAALCADLREINALTDRVLAERQQEPPTQLVPFVGWLRAKLGHYLPGVRSETWQEVGYLILLSRGVRP